MQRAICWLLFAVFMLGPVAPAIAAAPAPQPIACHRPKMEGPGSTGMAHCHDMAMPNGAQSSAIPPENPGATLTPNNCCNDHDCCRRQDRSQGVQLTARISLHRVDKVVKHLDAFIQSRYSAAPSIDHSGRAPPLLQA